MVTVRLVLIVLLAVVVAVAAGCSGGSEDQTPRTGDSADTGDAPGVDQSSETSEAARARGLTVEREQPEDKPVVTLEGMAYEWRAVPDKGLLVSLEMNNANEVFERARAYVFAIVHYSGREASSKRAFPLGVELVDGVPADYTEGTHVLYRKDHTLQCFVPYEDREGYYDRLRVMIYSEEGDLLIDTENQLEVSGEPTGRVKVKPTLAL